MAFGCLVPPHSSQPTSSGHGPIQFSCSHPVLLPSVPSLSGPSFLPDKPPMRVRVQCWSWLPYYSRSRSAGNAACSHSTLPLSVCFPICCESGITSSSTCAPICPPTVRTSLLLLPWSHSLGLTHYPRLISTPALETFQAKDVERTS